MEAVRRIDDFLQRRPMPFHLWLRNTAFERLLHLRRAHLRAKRSVQKEDAWPDRSSVLLVRPLLTNGLSPEDLLLRAS